MSNTDTVAINQLMANIFTQMSNITGNSTSRYNQLGNIILNQPNINNLIYNGIGNIFSGNIFVNNSLNINGNLLYSNLNLTGNFSLPNSNISSTSGNIVLNNSYINNMNGNLIFTSGNITSTVGNINMNNGNINVTTGNVILSNGDLNINGNLYLAGLATVLGQSGFKVQYGISGSVTSSINVVFDEPFNTVPTIISTGFRNSATPTATYVTVVSTTGATIFSRDDTGTLTSVIIYWIAIGT